MNSWIFRICIASLLATACAGDGDPAATPPPPRRGYVAAPEDAPRPVMPTALPRPAAPLDPAEVTPDQPENVVVSP